MRKKIDGNNYRQTFSHEIAQLLFEKTWFSNFHGVRKITMENETLAIVAKNKPEPS